MNAADVLSFGERVMMEKPRVKKSYLRRHVVKHPGPDGSPIHSTGTDQSVHGAWATGLSAPRLFEALKSGGFTIHDPSGEVPTSGWVVALSKDTERSFPFNVSPSRAQREIRKYRSQHWKELQDPSTFYGGWLDGDQAYLDISQVFDDKEEAIRAGRERDQLAIFHLDTFETLYLNDEEE